MGEWFPILADHLKPFEALRLKAYDDLQPARDINHAGEVKGTLTIGYGHTGPDVQPGMEITEAQADELLSFDVGWAARAVEKHVRVDMTAHEKAALVSFVFNVGSGAFKGSTLLRKLNAGDRVGAAGEFARWNKSKGQVLRGLVRRREAERALFLGDADGAEGPARGDITGGEAKPIVKSKTGGLAGAGLVTAIITAAADAAGTVQEFLPEGVPSWAPVAVLGAICALIYINRWREAQRGEH